MLASVAACSGNPTTSGHTPPAIELIRNARDMGDTSDRSFIAHPLVSGFSVCHGHTCRYINRVGLGHDEWNSIRQVFAEPFDSAEQEREKIREAIGLFETLTGNKIGTSNDKAESFAGLGETGQMDCVDEATNTSVYLTLLQNAGLLRWHVVDYRISRGVGSLQAPHFTAVIKEIQTGRKYAVDSWFRDNGEIPYIIPLSVWKGGWKPAGSGD